MSISPNKFNSGTTKDYCTGISNNKTNEFELAKVSEDVGKKFYFA